ncbi:alpha/beta hydrolase [Leeuwenhoekiella sp. A16]|uniref:alpha/beta hydrolase n=1 Tax=unclassified Leeuwenhoekiella TaxID=2615029 RepID=UPI003A80DA91
MTKFSLEHLIRKPSITTVGKPPLLLLLHGYGSNEEDLFSFAPELPGEYYIISARAPMPMPPSGNAWYTIYWDAPNGKWSDDKEAIEARDLISKFITEAIKTYELDENNVTLIGFSQGTILSYAVALTYPEKIKNVVALSGYINTDITQVKEDKSAYNNLNIFCSHGTVDQVIPVNAARMAPAFLKELGIETTLKEYPVGHGVAPQNFYDAKSWLEAHK